MAKKVVKKRTAKKAAPGHGHDPKRRSRKGVPNKSTIEKKARAVRFEMLQALAPRFKTKKNLDYLQNGIDALFKRAGSGDVSAIRAVLEIQQDVYSASAADLVADLMGCPDLDSDYSTGDVQAWILKTMADIESEEAQRRFLSASLQLFVLAERREKIDAMWQQNIPADKMRRMFRAHDDIIKKVLGSPEHAHLLETYEDLMDQMEEQHPEVFDIEPEPPSKSS